jgi:recombination protein RecR
MPAKLPSSVQNLIDAFSRLPGIGSKMASRLTFHLLQKSDYDVNRFINALDAIRHGLQDCKECGNIAEGELCSVCEDATRSKETICVVEGPLDVIALERTGAYHAVYHVLGGVLSPIDGIGPDQLRIRLLEQRVKNRAEEGAVTEIILATNPSLEGEATSMYINQLLQPFIENKQVSVTRIARGLPMGSDLEYADPTTLLRALEGRKTLT